MSASAYYERGQGPAISPRDRGRAPARPHPRGPRAQLLRLRLPADVDRPEARGRGGRQGPRAAADARGRASKAPSGVARPWRTTKPDPEAQRRPDLVERDFSAAAPNRLWVGDFTYLRSWEGASFFSFVIDAFSRKVVGWQLASHMRTDLVLDALRMALGQREPGADFAARGPHRSRLAIHVGRLHPGHSTTTASWPRSAPSATPMTTRWPRASSTPSRPS